MPVIDSPEMLTYSRSASAVDIPVITDEFLIIVPSGSLKPHRVDSIVPDTVNFEEGSAVPIPM